MFFRVFPVGGNETVSLHLKPNAAGLGVLELHPVSHADVQLIQEHPEQVLTGIRIDFSLRRQQMPATLILHTVERRRHMVVAPATVLTMQARWDGLSCTSVRMVPSG